MSQIPSYWGALGIRIGGQYSGFLQ